MRLAYSSPLYEKQDWLLEVASGVVDQARIIVLSGWSNNVSTEFNVLWNSLNTEDIESLSDTPSTVKLASTSANDTNSSGSGARSVTIEGVDSTGAIFSENVKLNGISEVISAGTYQHIFKVTVLTAGNTRSNEGDIWVGNGIFTVGVPATKYAMMPVGYNVSHTPSYMVPSGRNFVAVGRTFSTDEISSSFTFRVRYHKAGAFPNYPLIDKIGQNGNLDSKFIFLPTASNLDLLVLEASSNASPTSAAGSIYGVEFVSDPSLLNKLYS